MNVHFLKKQKKKKNPAKTWEMHLALQLIRLLFAELSSEMGSVEEQLLGEMGIKCWGMPHFKVRKKEQLSQYWSIKMAMPHINFQAC